MKEPKTETRKATKTEIKKEAAPPPPQPPGFFVLALFLGRAGLLQRIRVPFKPMLRALRLQMGRGLRPPQPPLSFVFLRPVRFALTHTSPFQTRAASIAFANGGGLRPPQPPRSFFFKAGQACFKAYECLSNPCCKNCVCKWGGLRPPPPPAQPPALFFKAGQACFKAYECLSNPCCKNCVCKWGGLRPRSFF